MNKLSSGSSNSMLVQLNTDGVPKLLCPVCNKALTSLSGYVAHVKKHEPPGGFICRYCEAPFCSEDDLKKHRIAEHTTLVCRICKNVHFASENDYREHIKNMHKGMDRELFRCDKCGAEYKSADPYRRHVETKCGTIKPFKCDQCEMSFITKYNLKNHKEIHSGERKYCCSFCGKDFVQKSRLIEHERSHTGEKPYKCDVCGKCFAHRESIVTHSSLHTGIRLVECRCCQTRFSCHSNLIKHRRARPSTCGLPEFDPPKNRARNFVSRIPALLNPSSEIKISNRNKIIKPEEEKRKKANTSLETRKGTGKRGRPRKSKTDSLDSYENNKKDKNKSSPKRRSLRKSTINRDGFSIEMSHENEIEDNDETGFDLESDFEGYDNDLNSSHDHHSYQSDFTDNENEIIPKVSIKEEQEDFYDEGEVDFEDYEEGGNEEFINSANSSPPSYFTKIPNSNVKQEKNLPFHEMDENNDEIFNDRDKLLRDLLSDENDSDTESHHTIMPKTKVKKENNYLLETEMILVHGSEPAEMQGFQSEDIHEVVETDAQASAKCCIVLDDITKHYPQLKDGTSIKLEKENNCETSKATKNNKSVRREARVSKRKRKTNKKPDPISTDYNIDAENNVELTVEYNEKSFDAENDQDNSKDQDFEMDIIIDEINEDENSNEKKPPTAKGGRRGRLTKQELRARLKLIDKSHRTLQCPHCIRVYHMRKPFENHMRGYHNASAEEIKNIFKDENRLGAVADEVFKCPICEKIYLLEKRLQEHIKFHGPDGSLAHRCPCGCNAYFATKDEATEHAKTAHRERVYCELCDKFFIGLDSLKNHMKNFHSEKEPRHLKRNLVCDKCGKKFPGRTSLTDHVRSDCGRKPIYPCNICGKHLTTAGILKTHLLLHSDETPFQCEQCGKTFKVKSQYKTHIKSKHSDNKPFKCHLCSKAYPYRESLLTHMTVHTGIKRFLCNGCGKRFTCISNLQAHRKVHSDSCGLLPLNPKATQYMGVQKGQVLIGSKPEAGLDYKETNTLLAKDILDRDLPMSQELNYPSEPSAPLATVPLSFKSSTLANASSHSRSVNSLNHGPEQAKASSNILHIPEIFSEFIDDNDDPDSSIYN